MCVLFITNGLVAEITPIAPNGIPAEPASTNSTVPSPGPGINCYECTAEDGNVMGNRFHDHKTVNWEKESKVKGTALEQICTPVASENCEGRTYLE